MSEMTRKKKLFFNIGAGIIKQITSVVCGFILPRYFLVYYGSSVNGLVSSIVNFLGFISFLDMGVGAVVQANLYKPLADKDSDQISRIVKSSERFFRRIAYIFIGYIVVLCFILPRIVSFETWYTVSLLIIISISTLAQYMMGITYQLLLTADQKSYVQLSMQIVMIIVNTFLAIILMKMGASIHVVKLMTTIVYVLRPLGQMIYVHKHYTINRGIKVIGEPIRQKWNGFSQHFAAVVCQNIDVAVLTIFSSLEKVSVYTVYFLVTNGVEQIVLTAATGLESLFGNMIAKNEDEKLLETFNVVEWITHVTVTFIFTVAALTIVPFVSVYTRGVKDTNYITPVFGTILVIAYGSQCLRIPYFRVIKAAGHFKETQNGAYISAGLNIVITVVLVFKFGLVGAAIGTLVAMLYHTVYFVGYLQGHILNRSGKYFIGYLISDSVVAITSYVLTRKFLMLDLTYFSWIVLAVKVAIVVMFVSILVNILAYRKQVRNLFILLNKKE